MEGGVTFCWLEVRKADWRPSGRKSTGQRSLHQWYRWRRGGRNMLDFMSWDGMIHTCASFLLSQGFFMEDVNCSFYIYVNKKQILTSSFLSTFILHRLRWGSGQSTPAIVAGQSWSRVMTPLRLMEILPKKRWDHCTEMRSEVLSCWSQFFQSWRKKNQVPQKSVRWSCCVLGGGIVVLVFGELDLCITRTVAALAHWWWTGPGSLNFTSTPLPFNSRIREPYQNLHVFREVFPKRNPYALYTKKTINIHYTHIIIYIYTHMTILQIINKHMLYIHVYVNITTWLFFHRSKFPPMPALPVTWAW